MKSKFLVSGILIVFSVLAHAGTEVDVTVCPQRGGMVKSTNFILKDGILVQKSVNAFDELEVSNPISVSSIKDIQQKEGMNLAEKEELARAEKKTNSSLNRAVTFEVPRSANASDTSVNTVEIYTLSTGETRVIVFGLENWTSAACATEK